MDRSPSGLPHVPLPLPAAVEARRARETVPSEVRALGGLTATTFALLVMEGHWSPRSHWIHHANIRKTVVVALLVANSLIHREWEDDLKREPAASCASHAAETVPVAKATAEVVVVPSLPVELWVSGVLRFLSRSDWLVKRPLAWQHPPVPSAHNGGPRLIDGERHV
jgi:hypothetical protein